MTPKLWTLLRDIDSNNQHTVLYCQFVISLLADHALFYICDYVYVGRKRNDTN